VEPSDAAQGHPGWESPWGWGRPGWHLECSAMSAELLGVPFDLHGGGQDLLFPHHENECAQSCAALGESQLARMWVHNGILRVEGEKMSKSLGNFITVQEACQRYGGEVVRWVLLSAHYRHPLNWTESLVTQARASLDRLYGACKGLEDLWEGSVPVNPPLLGMKFLEALKDDLNTPLALSHLHEAAHAIHKEKFPDPKREKAQALYYMMRFLGFFQKTPQAWFQEGDEGSLTAQEIQDFIDQRHKARLAKNFSQADRIRAHLEKEGIFLEDTPQGATWRRG